MNVKKNPKGAKVTQNSLSWGRWQVPIFYVCDHLRNVSKVHMQRLKKKYSVIVKKWWNIYTERQTNRETETDSLIWLTSSTEVRILKYDWLREFWATIWEANFSQAYNFPRILKGHKTFILDHFQIKLMTWFS